MCPRTLSAMARWCVLFVFVIVIGTGHCSSCGCDGPDIDNAQTCESLFRLFEDTLLSDGSNIYKLRNLLYPFTTAPPELANITYHLQFTNATGGSAELPDSSGKLPSCLCPGEASNRTLLNTSGIITLRYGWTDIGIYTIIDPALLSQFQLQLPFAIMRLVAPDGVPFLWNGYNQLPSISLYLIVSTDNLTCLPGHSEVDGVLKRLTSYLKHYAWSGQAVGGGRGDLAEVSYVLDGQLVSNVGDIVPNCASFMIWEASPIVLIATILYLALIASCLIVSSADKFIKGVAVVDHQSVPFVNGFLICMLLFGFFVTVAEMIFFPWNCFVSSSIKFKLSIPLMYFVFFLSCIGKKICFNKHYRKCTCSSCCYLWKFFVVALLSTFSFSWLFTCFFPTLLLGFAYPLNVFSLVLLHVAFVYTVTVVIAPNMGKIIFWRNLHCTKCPATVKKMIKTIECNLESVLFLLNLILYIIFGICIAYVCFMIVYSLTIVRGLVTTDGVSAAVSLIPALPVFLTGWLIKRRFFADTEDYDKLVTKVVYKLISLQSLSIPHSRMDLGKELGIPVNKLESIEFEASRRLDMIQKKKIVLERMMSYWFEKNCEASLDKLAEKLVEMNLDPQGTCTNAIRELAASLRAAGGSSPPATHQRPQVSSPTRRRESDEQGETQPLLTETHASVQDT